MVLKSFFFSVAAASSRAVGLTCLFAGSALFTKAAEPIANASARVSLIADGNLAQWRQLQPVDDKADTKTAITYRDPDWTLEKGVLRSKEGTGDLMTRRRFGNYQLHLEWRNSAGGSDAGGVFLDGKHMVALKASDADSEWHVIEIAYTHLRGQTPKSTVWIDGREVAKDTEWKQPSKDGLGVALGEATQGVELDNAKTGKALLTATDDLGQGEPELPEIDLATLAGPTGPIRLRASSADVEFRKIWIRPLDVVDHAEMIQSFDKDSFARGESIYAGLCVNCHGKDGITPSLSQSRAFGKGEMKFGTHPHAMYLTLTHGNGLMGPQTWMEPRERYDVIHYIREKFMKPMREDYREVEAKYLASLPRGISGDLLAERSENERDFGPALASQLQKRVVSAMTVNLGEGFTASYNLHDMSLAGTWKGGFLDLSATQHERLRGEGQPQPAGKVLPRLQTWFWGHGGALDYSKEDLLPRGPLPADWLDYKGHFIHGDRLMFSYSIDGREVFELPGKQKGFDALVHTLRIGPGKNALKLCVGKSEQYEEDFIGLIPFDSTAVEVGIRSGAAKGHALVGGEIRDGVLAEFTVSALIGDTEALTWSVDSQYRLVLDIPTGDRSRELQIVRYAGRGAPQLQSLLGLIRNLARKEEMPDLVAMTKGGPANWPETLTSTGELGSDSQAYTLDTLTLPESNPWNAWLRTAALDFMSDGRMVVSTHGGDIWIISGIDKEMKELKWKRFAAGLYEPFGVKVVADTIYVTCKDRVVRLRDRNYDGEADFYENFSADTDVSIFFHAFNFDLQTDDDGNFYYAKAGQYTDHALPGAIIKISPDGKRREVYCTGFRTPNGMGMMPDGRPTVSDNQGTWIPASKVSIVKKGGFYGYVNNVKNPNWAPDGGRIDVTKVIPPKSFDQPIIWMPQEFDNSSGGQLFVDDARWGPLSGKLLHTSFGKGWLYYFMVQDVGDVSQAAIVKLPLDFSTGIHRARVNPKDGQVYAVGLNGWNGGGRKELVEGGIQRTRYTGAPVNLLTDVQVRNGGIELSFNFELDPNSANRLSNYEMEQWNYKWLQRYGSDQWSVKDSEIQGHDPVRVTNVTVAPEGNRVFLTVPDIQPVNQIYAQLSLRTVDGELFEEQVYMTVNRVPGE